MAVGEVKGYGLESRSKILTRLGLASLCRSTEEKRLQRGSKEHAVTKIAGFVYSYSQRKDKSA